VSVAVPKSRTSPPAAATAAVAPVRLGDLVDGQRSADEGDPPVSPLE
jgi:hypothetical protein